MIVFSKRFIHIYATMLFFIFPIYMLSNFTVSSIQFQYDLTYYSRHSYVSLRDAFGLMVPIGIYTFFYTILGTVLKVKKFHFFKICFVVNILFCKVFWFEIDNLVINFIKFSIIIYLILLILNCICILPRILIEFERDIKQSGIKVVIASSFVQAMFFTIVFFAVFGLIIITLLNVYNNIP